MSGMWTYFARRLLLVPITFLVITFMVYAVLRVTPGGPIEQLENQMRAAAAQEGGGGGGGLGGTDVGLDEKAREELRAYYNLDQPIPIAYLQWLGVYPRKDRTPVTLKEREADPEFWDRVEVAWVNFRETENAYDARLQNSAAEFRGSTLLVEANAALPGEEAFFQRAGELLSEGLASRSDLKQHLDSKGWQLSGTRFMRPVTDVELAENSGWAALVSLASDKDQAFENLGSILAEQNKEASRRGSYYNVQVGFSGILQGDFGRSFTYNEDALDVITQKFPISIYFGLIGYLATWLICIPLGIGKAVHHRGLFDTSTSVLVFLGYATPGFVACLLLLVLLGGGTYWNVVPLGGFRSEGWGIWWEQGEYWRCIKDQVHHTLVPMFGYLVGSFASMTVLMKNSLLENFGADYVRTAFAKGLPERRVIYVHALRNSLIPITAGIGHFLGIIFAGSFLIEKVCNIPGMGLLGYESIIRRDYPIILATLVFGVLIRLTGNILSDFIWAAIDPRIRFK
ncbi:MAG: ABC transporter permease subunit [Planctomycetota bacterium]